jgi:hypothetical protein
VTVSNSNAAGVDEAVELAEPSTPSGGTPRSGQRLRRANRIGAAKWPLIATSLAALVVLSQLPFTHLKMDDFIHRTELRGTLPLIARWDLFRFFSGNPAETRALVDAGLSPWFVAPDLKLGFFRPLSTLLAAFDDAVFDGFAPGYLLHGGLWYLALCALAAVWYQKHLPGSRGGIAAVIFAVAASHQQTVAWFAARNSVVAAVWGMLALLAHERARERTSPRARLGSVVALALALSAGEAGLGAVAFLVASECTERQASWGERLQRLWPALGLTALYFAGYALLGYGASGSGTYIDPLHHPLHYLRVLPERLLVSLGVLWLNAPADLWFLVPAARPGLLAVGVLAGVGAAGWLYWGARRLGADELANVRVLALALFASLLPQMAGPLGSRSYTLPSVAAFGLLAIAVNQGLECHGSRLRRFAAAAGAALLLLLHVLGGPISWWSNARFQARVDRAVSTQQLELDMQPESVSTEDYVLLSVPDAFVGLYTPFRRASDGLPQPARFRSLSFGEQDHVVTRISERSFELEVVGGDVLGSPFAELLRDPDLGFRVGQRVETDGLSARVLELSPRGQPHRVEFTSSRSLDDPVLRLFAWHQGRMQPIALALGERRTLSWQAPY